MITAAKNDLIWLFKNSCINWIFESGSGIINQENESGPSPGLLQGFSGGRGGNELESVNGKTYFQF